MITIDDEVDDADDADDGEDDTADERYMNGDEYYLARMQKSLPALSPFILRTFYLVTSK